MELTDRLFRQNRGRMVAALTRIFGMNNLPLAEDVVQEAFCRAAELWDEQRIPENPKAWLMATAKNRALDLIRRRRTAHAFAPELSRWLQSEWTLSSVIEESFSPAAVKDDVLRMMFSCCDSRIAETGRVALILHILCGFTVDEVAAAFVTRPDAMAKRISRAKKVLATTRQLFEVTSAANFSLRVGTVQRALYLVFNEGYHGASPKAAVRAELCFEAMRLTSILMEHPCGDTPDTAALAALMSFHAARLPGRVNAKGELLRLSEQNRAKWNRQLLREGFLLMERAAGGAKVTEFHIEAAIASLHCAATSSGDTDWAAIVSLYDALMRIHPSPVVALNRAIAIGQRDGPDRGLRAVHSIEGRDKLEGYPFYPAALGELEERRGRLDRARIHFEHARSIARNPAERRFLGRRAAACQSVKKASPGATPRPG